VRRLNELGFDVDEVELIDAGDGSNRLRLRTRIAEPGHFRRQLFARTGLEAEENQARRLLNDIASYRSHLERSSGRPIPEAVAANRWLAEVYDPADNAIPEELRDKLDPVEVFHEILEHRWFLSERLGRDVGATAARNDYFAKILPRVPDDLTITAPHPGTAPDDEDPTGDLPAIPAARTEPDPDEPDSTADIPAVAAPADEPPPATPADVTAAAPQAPATPANSSAGEQRRGWTIFREQRPGK
jgi:hypothetical protein